MRWKNSAMILLAALFALCLSPEAGAQSPGQAQRPVIAVSTMEEFLRAIGPNRIIVLKKGDYDPASAYGVKSAHVQWYDSEDGKELGLSRLSGLSIRGEEGSRILVRSRTVYLLDISSSSDIELEGLSFVREVEDGRRVTGGGLYAEGLEGLRIEGCSFEGPNGYPLELRDCSDVGVSKVVLSGGFYGGFYVATSRDIRFDACVFRDMEGSILVSIEESGNLAFRDCDFRGNSGSTFVDIYSESGDSCETLFGGCRFSGNRFEFFSGPGPLPSTEDCVFEDNSFDADWALNSVAPQPHEGSDSYSTPELQRYEFAKSGLGLEYPSSWEIQSGEGSQRVGFFSPDGQSMLLFIPLDLSILPDAGPSDATTQATFDAALASLTAIMKKDADMKIDLSPESAPAAMAQGFLSASYAGKGSRPNGSSGALRARFVSSQGYLYCLVALAGDASLISGGTAAAVILASLGPGQAAAGKTGTELEPSGGPSGATP